MNPGGSARPRRQSFCCLLTFLAYLLLPLAHQWDLASQVPGGACLPGRAQELSEAGLISAPPAPGDSHHHHHDRSTCPLCQAALGLVKLALTSSPTILPVSPGGRDVSPPETATIFFSCHYLLLPSRAPPDSPLT